MILKLRVHCKEIRIGNDMRQNTKKFKYLKVAFKIILNNNNTVTPGRN